MTTIQFLTEWALRSSILILSGALLLQVLRVKDPSVRWVAWTAMLCASLTIPGLTAALPKLPLMVARAAPVPVAAPVEIDRTMPERMRAMSRSDVELGKNATAVSQRFDWARVVVMIYILVALALLLRLCFGLAMSVRLLRRSRATDRGTEGIDIRESDQVATPVALGISRSAIVLPSDWRQWDGATLDAVLAHERSHIRRHDPAVQLLSAIHRALLWHSPLSWVLHRRIVRVAEDASDDAAVAVTGDRALYADILLHFMQRGVRKATWQGVPMARYGRADGRIQRILDGTRLSCGVTRWSVAAILALGLPLACLVAAAHPQIASPARATIAPEATTPTAEDPLVSEDLRAALTGQGWTVSEERGTLHLLRQGPIPPESMSVLRHLPSPLSISLKGQNVTEVLALGNLKNVTQINLFETKVKDVSALGNLKNLTQLNLGATQVSDISTLRELKSLQDLNLEGTSITDLSPLRESNSLTRLNLFGTNVKDVSALRELTNLTRLDLGNTNVRDISALRELKNLTQLNLGATKVMDLSALRELENLTGLQLYSTGVTDLSPLREMKSLKWVDLRSTNVTDTSPLREMKRLERLELSATNVTNVSPLRELHNLTKLDLTDTKVKELSPLRDLTNLTELDLRYTSVTELSALEEMKKLLSLDLFHTQVTDVTALRGLKSLTYLCLAQTQVTDISPLRGLKSLRDLDLSATNVTDISALRDLTNLTRLELGHTKVADMSALGKLKDLTIDQ